MGVKIKFRLFNRIFAAVTLSGAGLLFSNDSFAAPARSDIGLTIKASSVAGVNQITIPTGSPAPKYSVTRLTQPERLVIDLEQDKPLNIQSIKPNGLEYVSGVRVGSHPNKTRVVIDLKGAGSLSHEAKLESEILVLTVASKAEAVKDLPKRELAPKGLATKEIAPKEIDPKEIVPKEMASKPSEKIVASTSTHLTLDEEPVVTGSSQGESAKPIVADRARLALPVLEKKMERAAILKPVPGMAQMSSPDPKGNLEDLGQLVSLELISAKPKDSQYAKATEVAAPSASPASPASEANELPAANQIPAVNPSQEQGAKADTAAIVADPDEIRSIVLDGAGKTSPAVVIKTAEGVQHSLTRTAPSEYVVTLQDASAAVSVLQQTLFATPESTGIRSVRAVADGKNTLVRIFTQPSSYLTAKRTGESLRIEETQDLTQIARDIRAQIVPASAKEVAANKEVKSKDALDGKSNKSAETADKPTSERGDHDSANPNRGELAAIKGAASSYTGRLISLDLQDADIDSALRIIAEVSNLNIVAGDGVVGKVTLKLVDVPWDQALEVILKSHGLDKVLEGNVLRVAPVDKLRTERESFKQARVAEEELEPLSVKYIRVSYAKAAEIKGLVETVLSERGSVAFDERSNQLVVKDTRKGLQNVSELIKKIDLRTPQILLETQIIEANRNLSRELGAELGFQYIQSPATGNGTGLNFPSAIAVGGSADPSNSSSITGSAFPVASSASLGSAVTMLFDSADGTKSLSLRLSQLEQEGQVRIISKPAVATTNNKAAEIKSVEKYRVKLPNGGLSIASGSGASSSGSGDVATQTIEAGIVLNVTPQASPDYYILLDIRAKSSSFGAKSVDGIPNEIERSASSSVLVSSGQTFALGGIYKITEQDRVAGVPFFKDIPVLGTLFRNTTTEQSDEELLFFITPRIVEGSFEDATSKINS
jgi:type IV pilus secretin PilQ/predicted competence protein